MSDGNSGSWNWGGLISRWLSGSQEHVLETSADENSTFNKEVSSAEGCLRIVPVNKTIELHSTLCEGCMLVLGVSLAGPLSKFVKRGGDNEVVITVPVSEADGAKHSIKITYYGSKKRGKNVVKLVRAGQGTNANGECFFELVYNDERDDFRYVIELDASIEVVEFKEVIDKRPLFQSVPPVAQMAAFLRAVTNRKRTVFDIIDSMKDYASPSTGKITVALREAVEEQGVSLSYEVPLRIKKLLSKQVNLISEHVILALALYIDMETGVLTRTIIAERKSIEASVASLYSVAKHFGATIGAEEWKFLFGDTELTLAEVQQSLLNSAYSRIVSQFGQQSSNRTPAMILRQIAKESRSMRALSFSQTLQERLGGNDIAISDQQLALLATLSVARRHYNPNLVAALCLFVDAEVGCIGEQDLQNAAIEVNGIETSTYAMLAVAGAFDVSLRGLNFGNLSQDELHVTLPGLVRLTEVGFLGGFRKSGESKQSWHWVRTNQAAAKALQRNRGIEFTNNVLCVLPVIEQLSEIDLVHLMESGRDFLAAFQSDYDKTLVWRRLSDIPEKSFRTPIQGKVRQSYSFIEGFSAYHFSRTVIGRIAEVSREELLGTSNVIMVYHDNRDNRHYKYWDVISSDADLEPPPNTGWVWKGMIVDNIDTSGLPSVIHEMSQNALLGRGVQSSHESRLLNWIYEALRKTILRKVDYASVADYPNAKSLFGDRLVQLRGGVSNWIDEYTYNLILDWFEESAGVDVLLPKWIFDCLNDDDQVEMVSLAMLYSIVAGDMIDLYLGSSYKQVDLASLRVLLNERISGLLEAESTSSRVLGLRLLAFSEFVPDANARLMVEYSLSRALDDVNSDAVFAACEGLVRLCFSHIIPLPLLTSLRRCESADEEEEEEEEEILPEDGVIDRHALRDALMDIEDWVADLKAKKSAEYKSMPFVGVDGSIDSTILQEFAHYLAGLRQASYDETGNIPRCYYALVPERQLSAICTVIVEAWKQMAASNGVSLCKMLEELTPAELFLDQRFYVQGNEKQLFDEFGVRPYLGGKANPLTVYHLKPDEIIAPYRKVSLAVSSSGKEESRFFAELARCFFSDSSSHMVVLRLHTADGVEFRNLETFLPVFETSRIVDLRTAEVFDPVRAGYIPVFRSITFSDEQIGHTTEARTDFQALMGLLGGKRIAVKADAAKNSASDAKDDASSDAEEDSSCEQALPEEPELDDWLGDEEGGMQAAQEGIDLEPFSQLAAQLRKSFGLPMELERQLINMLLIVERHSPISLVSKKEEG
ncbi:hypothetical protein IJT17_04700 [bacterium]|nr:hypothetical protein [bacterium]